MLDLQPGECALVISPHPDDETVALAGTIAAMVAAGITVDVLAVACTTIPMYGGTSEVAVRTREFQRACDVLGVRHRLVAWTDGPRAANPTAHLPELVALIEAGPGPSLATSGPAALFVPTGDAHHQDHLAVHRAGLAAARPGHRGDRPIPRVVVGYDGPEDRAWLAASVARPVLVDTSATWPSKEKALGCYATQLRADPHPRSIPRIHALDVACGAGIGAHTAERFALYRMETTP